MTSSVSKENEVKIHYKGTEVESVYSATAPYANCKGFKLACESGCISSPD